MTTPQLAAPFAASSLDELGNCVWVRSCSSARRVPVEVPLVQWPTEWAARDDLRTLRVPRILVVAPGSDPPAGLDELEDWVRAPVDRAEIEVRATTVARRAEAVCEAPRLDDDDLLWFRDRWRDVPQRRVAVVRLLVQRYRLVVRDEEVREACAQGPASVHADAVKTLIRRIQRGIEPLGLTLIRVRASGYVLDATS